MKKLLQTIKQSCIADNTLSSSRVSSYIIIALIGLMTLYFIAMGIYIVITEANDFIPNEMIIVYGSLLAHHLTLCGINKHNETKQKGIKE